MEFKKQTIISIGREYGSGGHEIARKIASKLGVPLYDRSILEEVAVFMGVDPDELHKYDEQPKRKFFSRTVRGHNNSNEGAVYGLQSDLLKEREAMGQSFVVVGRCADSLFKLNPGLVSIFITGDYKDKLNRVMEKRELSARAAANAIAKHDRNRKAYHNSLCDTKWGETRTYDLIINSSKLGIDGTVDFLVNYVMALQKKG